MRATRARVDVGDLIRRHGGRVVRYLRFLGCRAEEAEDLVQDVFLGILERPFEDRGDAATARYLRLAAKHRFISWRRAGKVRATFDDLDAADAAYVELAGEDGGDSRLAALKSCLDHVGERGRRALELRFTEGLARSRIAALLEVSDEGAKTLLRRTKEVLRDCIERSLAS
ncbi:MAG TPA: sigma-70 family RNA polymerase sigma factor [Planctomycetota bacterium]|nr:sigma-70 family RNA polymerase sigma factor [Planctomycetota bacterium]